MGLKLQDVPAPAGLRWVTQAFSEYFRHPLAYVGLFICFMFAVSLLVLLPWVGHMLLLMSAPLLTLTFILASHASQHGRMVQLGAFAAPWTQREPDRRRALLGLMLIHAASTAAVLWLCELADGGAFIDWLDALQRWSVANMQAVPPPGTEPSMPPEVPGAVAGGLSRLVALALLAVPFWFAPALVFWGGQGPAQALFSSALALWRARAAFVAYALGWLAAGLASIMVTSLLVILLGPTLAGLPIMMIGLVLSSAFYVSLYFSFRDCFGEP
ncbi:MAG TPA: BPSS1780 family membrane protein [Ideonella sp.]|jgi:hypothetical protein|nr:BPSS1780 family membrane protein [Ideonella sp.]